MTNNSKELIHSFLYRKLICYGALNLKGLVGNNGKWLDRPYTAVEFTYIFKNSPKEFLLDLLRSSKLALPPSGIFDDPRKYILDYNYVFFSRGNKDRRVGKSNISFCPKCIYNQIKEFGYGYLYADWLDSEWCDAHQQGMYYLPVMIEREALDAIAIILKGNIPIGSLQHTKSNTSHNGLGIFEGFYIKPAVNTSVNWAPCLKKTFLTWLRDYFNRIEDFNPELVKAFNMVGEEEHKWYYFKSCLYDYGYSGKRDYDSTLSYYMSILNETESELIGSFYKNNLAVRTIEVQIANGEVFNELLAVDSNKNCTRCEFYPENKCGMQKIIHQERLSDINVKFTSKCVNYCDYYLTNISHYYPRRSLSKVCDLQLMNE